MRNRQLEKLGLTQPMWPCFPGEDEWKEYESLWFINGEATKMSMEPCRDCTASYRDQMKRAGLCRRPETIFVRQKYEGETCVIGLSSMQPSRWKRALLGIGSELVHGTDPESRAAAWEALKDEQ